MPKDTDSVYYFGLRREDGTAKNPHPNSFLINRTTFWEVGGGYDEDFCGHYGKGDIFLRLLFARSCRIVQLEEPALVELDNAATPGLIRKTSHNRWVFMKKRWLLEWGKYRNGRTPRFEFDFRL